MALSRLVLLVSFVAGAAIGQTSTAFDVALIKPSNSSSTEHKLDLSDAGQFTAQNVAISALLPLIFQRKEDEIAGIPGWMRVNRYDIVAKTTKPIVGNKEQALAKLVLALFISDLKLIWHEETREKAAYALTIVKQKRESIEPGVPGVTGSCKRGAEDGHLVLTCSSAAVDFFKSNLQFMASDYIDKPIVDQTGLTGTFQFSLKWTPRRLLDEQGGITVFDALIKQLGLKLEPHRLGVRIAVIDSAEPAREK